MLDHRPGTEIDLWRIQARDLHENIGLFHRALAPEEHLRAASFRFMRDRVRFVTFRGATRLILSSYLRIAPHRIAFGAGPQGKPYLVLDDPTRTIHFNLTHADDFGILAISTTGNVGVDVEEIRNLPRAQSLVRTLFSPREHAEYDRLSADEKPLFILRCWTRKEAYLKATGEGLSFPIRAMTVSLGPGTPPRLHEVHGRPGADGRWFMHDLDPAPGFIGCLVGDAPDITLCWHDLLNPGGLPLTRSRVSRAPKFARLTAGDLRRDGSASETRQGCPQGTEPALTNPMFCVTNRTQHT